MELINYRVFFRMVLNGEIKLSNQHDANVFCSWVAGGQDFYAYGIDKSKGD